MGALPKRHDIPIDDLFTLMTPHVAEWRIKDEDHFREPGYDFIGNHAADVIGQALR